MKNLIRIPCSWPVLWLWLLLHAHVNITVVSSCWQVITAAKAQGLDVFVAAISAAQPAKEREEASVIVQSDKTEHAPPFSSVVLMHATGPFSKRAFQDRRLLPSIAVVAKHAAAAAAMASIDAAARQVSCSACWVIRVSQGLQHVCWVNTTILLGPMSGVLLPLRVRRLLHRRRQQPRRGCPCRRACRTLWRLWGAARTMPLCTSRRSQWQVWLRAAAALRTSR